MAGIVKTSPDGKPVQVNNGLPIMEDGKFQDKSNVGPQNEIQITVDMLPEDISKQFEDYMNGCQHKYFETLKLTRGKVVQKLQVPQVIHPGETSAPRIDRGPTRAEISNMLNESLHQALINQSGGLTNTLKNLLT